MAAVNPPAPAVVGRRILEEANRRLYERRAALQATREGQQDSSRPVMSDPAVIDPTGDAQPAAPLAQFNWHSERVAAVLRQAQRRRETECRQPDTGDRGWLHKAVASWQLSVNREAKPTTGNQQPATTPPIPELQSPIPIASDLAAAFLRHDLAGAGRVWLLLRHIDKDGRGWLGVDMVRAALTDEGSHLRVCGWRQLRNLLQEGQGILWEQDGPAGDGGRIWLRKPARVAAALGVDRMIGGRSVALPVEALLSGVGEVRAQFYAAFHSGRVGQRGRGTPAGKGRPIARGTIARLTGVPRRTQIEYEARSGIQVRHNYAIGERATTSRMQERAWKQGGTFRFVDQKGKQGKKNGEYIAWQMPNSYVGPHKQQSKSRTRRINQELADLRTEGGAGNGQEKVEKLYFEDGAAAGKAYNRDSSRDTYWSSGRGRPGVQIWFVIAGDD